MSLDTFYLPKESISYVNFPILREQQSNIEAIMTYALRVHSAVIAYNDNGANRIDINTDELQQYIALCRSSCEAMGLAEAVPYDALVEVRNIMVELLNLSHLYSNFGSTLFGLPTSTSDLEGRGL